MPCTLQYLANKSTKKFKMIVSNPIALRLDPLILEIMLKAEYSYPNEDES